jgi:hypothetical protein
MAILSKRRSSTSLPSVSTDKGVLVSRPSDKLTSTTGTRPDTGVSRPKPTVTTKARPSAKLTSALKGPAAARVTTGAKPTVNAGTPTSITTKTSGTTRPAITKSTSGSSKSTSGLAKTLTSALAGAGAGVAGKMVYDKLFPDKKTTTGGTKTTTGGTKTTTGDTTGGTKTTTGGTKTTTGGTKTTTGGTKTTTGGTKTTTGGTKTTTGGTKTTTGGTKTVVTPKTPVTPKGPGGTKTTTGGTSGSTGTVGGIGGTDEKDTDVIRNDDGSITNADGSTTYTYDDGSTITLDADGNVVSYEDELGEETIVDVDAATEGSEETVNDDGSTTYTFDDGSSMTIDADGNVIDQIESEDANEETFDEEAIGEEETEEDAAQYFQDEYGNVYDGDGNLIYSVDEGGQETWTDEYGNEYDWEGNLVAEADHSDYVYTDEYGNEYDWDGNLISEATPEEDYVEDEYAEDDYVEDEYTPDEEEEYSEDEYYDYGDGEYDVKKGGLITMMKRGGSIRHFEDGGYSDTDEEVQDWQNVNYNYGEDDDPTMTGYMSLYNSGSPRNTYTTADSEVMDTEVFDDGSYIEYLSDGSSITYDSDGNVYDTSASDEESGNRTETFDDGSTITYDAEGNVVGYTNAPDESGNYTQVFDDGSSITYDADGNVVDYKESPDDSITSGGSGEKDIYRDPATRTPADVAKDKVEKIQEQSAIDKMIKGITGSEYLGAGAAGAVLGALLGNSDLFSGGGSDRQAIDMTKVGNINPRTTDFGIGAPRYVTYDEYGARDQMPDLYGNELYKNLNAPGFNPVNEGDYDMAEEPALAEETEEVAEAPKMAAGGLADTYYTFGKAVDPLENLRNPQPMQQGPAQAAPQAMPQGMPQQMPQQGGLGGLPQGAPQGMPKPQGMPQAQGMPPGMRSGGLPALSNVPFKEGRLDFRKGSAVHGPGDGQSDDIPAMLADGEYVIDAETVAQIGNGSTKAGAKALDTFRENIRAHKRSAPLNKIPPKTKTLTSYLKKGK